MKSYKKIVSSFLASAMVLGGTISFAAPQTVIYRDANNDLVEVDYAKAIDLATDKDPNKTMYNAFRTALGDVIDLGKDLVVIEDSGKVVDYKRALSEGVGYADASEGEVYDTTKPEAAKELKEDGQVVDKVVDEEEAKSVKIVNDAATAEDMRTALIKLEYAPYIDLGSAKRLEVAELFLAVEGKIEFKSIEEIESAIDVVINQYNTLIAEVNNAKTISTVRTALQAIVDTKAFALNNLSDPVSLDVAEKVFNAMQAKDFTSFTTIGAIDKETIVNDGGSDSEEAAVEVTFKEMLGFGDEIVPFGLVKPQVYNIEDAAQFEIDYELYDEAGGIITETTPRTNLNATEDGDGEDGLPLIRYTEKITVRMYDAEGNLLETFEDIELTK